MEIETGKTNQAHFRDPMHSINNTNEKMTDNKPLIPDVPLHPGPVYRPLAKPIRHDVSNQQGSQSSPGIEDINPNINLDFKDNSPFQECVMSKTFQRLDKSFFQEPKELGDLTNKGKPDSEVLAKTGRYRKNPENNSRKNTKRDTFTSLY